MPHYSVDLQDFYFSLFHVLKIQDLSSYGSNESDLKDILQSFEKFVRQEIYPTRQESDHEGVSLKEGVVTLPKSFHKVLKNFYENGWYAIGVPEKWEGVPMPYSFEVALTSIANGANIALGMYPGLAKAAMNVLIQVASPSLQQKFIPRMMEGKWGGTMCLTEPSAGSDVGALKTTATPIAGTNLYSIKGNKIFISSGENDFYENIIHLVLARTPNAPEGTKGLSLFIVPKYRLKENGEIGEFNDVFCDKIEEKMGLHAQATCSLVFGGQGNNSCQGFLLGEEGQGIATMFLMMNEARLLCGIQGESQANAAYEMARQYAAEREQFGTKLENFPDIKRMLGANRSMVRALRAIHLFTGHSIELEKTEHEKYVDITALLTPICKVVGSECGFKVTVDAVQIFGGYGYCQEYGMEQFCRDAKITTIYEGTTGIQAIDFVTRKILKNQGIALMALAKECVKHLKIGQEFAGKLLKQEDLQALQEALNQGNKIVEQLTKWVMTKQQDKILSVATDTLTFFSLVLLADQLLAHSLKAIELQKTPNRGGFEESYLNSKIEDFSFFTRYHLRDTLGIFKTIMSE